MERFLAGKYPDIADKLETKAVKKSVEDTEGVKETKEEKEEAYLERIERIASTKRGREILHNRYFKESLVNIDDNALIDKLAQNLFQSEKQQAINEGHGAELPEELSEEMLEKYRETILRRLENQKESLERITTYIEKNEDSHPLWFRYFMLRSIQGMGTYDAESNSYLGRTEETIAPFIHLNHEAVGLVRKMLEEKHKIKEAYEDSERSNNFSNAEQKALNTFEYRIRKGESLTAEEQEIHAELKERYQIYKTEKKSNASLRTEAEEYLFDNLDLPFESEEEKNKTKNIFAERLKAESFQDLYAFARKEVYADIKYVTNQGVWRHFEKGSNPESLEEILKNKGTGWCTASGSAPEHLEGGDFYIYQTYTKVEFARLESGEEVEPTQPAIAVRMLNDEVYEVRGTEPDQGITSLFNDVAMEQVRKLPGGEKWEKKSADMKLLTKLSKKQEDNEPFTKEELRFLYEINSKIEGFGYDIDPRIKELINDRDSKQDLITIFDAEGKTADAKNYPWPEDTKVLFGEVLIDDDTELPEALQYIEGTVYFTGREIHSGIAGRLIDIKQGRVVAEHIKNFKDLDHVHIADRLIEEGYIYDLAYNLYNFSNLSPDIADKIIEAGGGWSIPGCLLSFADLNHPHIVDKLIDARLGHEIVDGLEKYTGLDYAGVADKLIEAGEGESVTNNLDKFTNLNSGVALHLIEAGKSNRVAANLNCFTRLTPVVALRLIKDGYPDYVKQYLSSFDTLPEEVHKEIEKHFEHRIDFPKTLLSE